MLNHSPRVAHVVSLIEDIVRGGERSETVALMANLVGLLVLVKEGLRAKPQPNKQAQPDLMTCRETAALLRVNEETVRVLCRQGKLPCVRVGRCLRVPREAVERMKRTM